MQNRPIRLWAKDDRPREKLMNKGPESLSNAELLAILINNGTADASALDLAKQLLDSCDNRLHQLSRMTVHEILQTKVRGIGPAKAVSITAALTLANRREIEEKCKVHVNHSDDIAKYLKPHLQYLQHEVFMVIYMDNAHHILCHKIISTGGITSTIVDVRIVYKLALQFGAVFIVLAHNHPSGTLRPSRQDLEVTSNIREAGKTMNITLLDHIIISDNGFFSFADNQLIK